VNIHLTSQIRETRLVRTINLCAVFKILLSDRDIEEIMQRVYNIMWTKSTSWIFNHMINI
jgi:hypothetical protein